MILTDVYIVSRGQQCSGLLPLLAGAAHHHSQVLSTLAGKPQGCPHVSMSWECGYAVLITRLRLETTFCRVRTHFLKEYV